MLFLLQIYEAYIMPFTSSGIGAPAFRQMVEMCGWRVGSALFFFGGLPYAYKKIKARQRLALKELTVSSRRLQTNGVYYVTC